jgi:hypothetical protein
LINKGMPWADGRIQFFWPAMEGGIYAMGTIKKAIMGVFLAASRAVLGMGARVEDHQTQ